MDGIIKLAFRPRQLALGGLLLLIERVAATDLRLAFSARTTCQLRTPAAVQ
jgi:hypothetical protein